MEKFWPLEEVLKLIEATKDSGVTSITVNGLTIRRAALKEVKAIEVKKEMVEIKAEDLIAPMKDLENLTEEEIKFYATPYFDELQAEKQERLNKLQETVT